MSHGSSRPSTVAGDRQLRVSTPSDHSVEPGDGSSRVSWGEGCEHGSMRQCAGVNLPKGEGKLYSRFYRDPPVMDILGSVVLFNVARQHLLNATSNSVRVWCCGCSSGEEVWSVRFLWKELLQQYASPHLKLEIIGTDTSEAQIATCKSATYSSAGMGTLPKGWKERCFVAAGQHNGDEEYLVGKITPSDEMTTSMQGVKLVSPEVGMPVLCSKFAPGKVQAAFKQNSQDATGTISEIAQGQCKVAFVESGQVMWCSTGKSGFHLAPSLLSVCPDLREGVNFEVQDVRHGVPSSGEASTSSWGEGGCFDVILCRYSAFLYLSTEEAQGALKAMVDCMAPGGYLVIGQREMLPLSKNLSLRLNRIAECSCIYQKDGGLPPAGVSPVPCCPSGGARPKTPKPSESVEAAAARAPWGRPTPWPPWPPPTAAAAAQVLPAMVQYETLDDFYVEGLHLKGVQTALGRQPWDGLLKRHLSQSSAKILEASDRHKGPVLERIECAEEVRLGSAKKLCEQGGIARSVKKAVYKPSLIESMAKKKEQEESLLSAANRVVPAHQLRQFVDRMASDMARRQDKMREFCRDRGQEAASAGKRGSKRLKLSRARLVPRVATLVPTSKSAPPPRRLALTARNRPWWPTSECAAVGPP